MVAVNVDSSPRVKLLNTNITYLAHLSLEGVATCARAMGDLVHLTESEP